MPAEAGSQSLACSTPLFRPVWWLARRFFFQHPDRLARITFEKLHCGGKSDDAAANDQDVSIRIHHAGGQDSNMPRCRISSRFSAGCFWNGARP